MTGKEDPTKDEPRTVGEKEVRRGWGEIGLPIGQALQRAAGPSASGLLLCRENPWLADSGGAHPPILDIAIRDIFRAGDLFIEVFHNPRAVEAKLEAVRRDIKRLRNRIASLGENIQIFIDLNGDPGPITELNLSAVDEAEAQAELEALESVPIADREPFAISRARSRLYFVPHEEHTVPVALAAMVKLDAAIVLTLEEAIEAGEKLPATGRIPNVTARDLAYVVARYLRDVTGDIPGLTTKPVVTGPFALALQDIFEILDIKADIQRAGEWAISELTSKLSENSEFCP